MATGFDTTLNPPRIDKDPQADLVYGWNWAPWLGVIADTIDTAAWTLTLTNPDVVGAPLTISGQENGTTYAYVKLRGGTVNQIWRVTCHIETDAGNEDDRSFRVRIKER